MNAFRTVLNLDTYPFEINHHHSCLLIGSCFSDTIGQLLSKKKFSALSNPAGTIFNPISIAKIIEYALSETTISASQIRDNQGKFFHWDFHGCHANASKEHTLDSINYAIQNCSNKLASLNYVFVTLGTSLAYYHREDQRIVANCHKVDNTAFDRVSLDVDNIVDAHIANINALSEINSNVKWIYTVSPVRHIRDGLVDNQLSKSKLIVAAHELEAAFENVFYFPSYEMIMDDLRDYRFYTKDSIHINEVGIEYIWQFFCDAFLSKETLDLVKQIERVNNSLAHKPSDPQSKTHHKHLRQTAEVIQSIISQHPHIDYSSELALIDKNILG